MKINQDYMKQLLHACQATEEPTFDIEDLRAAGLNYNDPQFAFHMSYLNDRGFIERDDGDPGFGLIRGADDSPQWSVLSLRLTASGHQFIDDSSQQEACSPTNNEPTRQRTHETALPLISETRLHELRTISVSRLDLRKLIRLCEEINIAYCEECYYATAMLTRAMLDHVPPVFGCSSFSEVTNNYSGGGKSFKETMHHLENAARKIADAHLHMRMRESEALPTAQQVNCGQQLDVLLAEIVRIV